MSNSTILIPDQGPPGQPAAAITGAQFAVPAIGQQVTVQLGLTADGRQTSSEWMFAPQPIAFSSPAGVVPAVSYGTYNVVATPTSGSVTLQNNGAAGNPTPGTQVPAGAGISTAGLPGQGPVGQTTANFALPNVGSTGPMVLKTNVFVVLGGNLFISGSGGQAYLVVTAVNTDGVTITVQNNGAAENTATPATILAGAQVTMAGAGGPAGSGGGGATSGPLSVTLLSSFVMPALGATVPGVNFPTAGFPVGRALWIPGTGLGNMLILQSITDAAHAVLLNPPVSSYVTNNSVAGTTIAATTVTTMGPVSSCALVSAQVASNTSGWMVRRMTFARDNLPWVRIGFGAWAALTGVETALTGNMTITASVEYPIGSTPTRLTFGGANSGTVIAGQTLLSDAVTLPVMIPAGAKYAIRFFQTGATQIPYTATSHINVAGGEAISSTSGDLTGSSATFTDGGNGFTMSPVCILGPTNKITLALTGDSRSVGLNDNTTDGMGDYGTAARMFGRAHAYIQLGASGELAAGFVSTHALRLPLAQLCTVVIDAHGINDIDGGTAPATLQATMNTLYGLVTTQPVIVLTNPPRTTDTSGSPWTTLVNQVVDPNNGNRVAMNTWWRNLGSVAVPIAGNVIGCIDWANVVESSYNSGKWAVTGSGLTGNDNQFTTDGLHESSFANRLAVPLASLLEQFAFFR